MKPPNDSMPWEADVPEAWARTDPPPPHVDLHAHSTWSDGTLTPGELAGLAGESGVEALALTDHDGTLGFEEFSAAARDFEAIPGVEVSSLHGGVEIHMLGLLVRPEDPLFCDRLAGLRRDREERIRRITERLRENGIPIDDEEVLSLAGKGAPGRPHVARVLVAMEVVESVDQAFRLWLRRGQPGHVSREAPTPEEAISWIHEAGGVAVLAHPGTFKRNSWIRRFAEAGLDGLEVWHPRHPPRLRRAYLRLARELHLVPSGGSDYHGPEMGKSVPGQEPVPREILERFRDRSRRYSGS
jgi:predicted metal-dependent phosphoesterase TrpH